MSADAAFGLLLTSMLCICLGMAIYLLGYFTDDLRLEAGGVCIVWIPTIIWLLGR